MFRTRIAGCPTMSAARLKRSRASWWRRNRRFATQFAIDCRTRCEVIGISSAKRTVELKNHATGEVTTEHYDKLVLSPGAAPIRPPLPGIDLPGIFSVRTVPDAREMREWLERGTTEQSGMNSYTGYQTVTQPKRAVVVGGGFIGLEMVENLIHRGLEVTLIEKLNQVMPPLDPEMARLVERYMVKHGVRLELNDGVAGFQQSADGSLEVLTSSGKRHPADIVILAIGVRPETALAKMAGIEIGQRGGIRVDEHMRTSEPRYLRSRRRGRGQEISSPANGRSFRWPGRQTGRAGSRPTSLPGEIPVSAAPRVLRSVRSSRPRSPRPAPARRCLSNSETRISRRSTSTRIRTRGIIRAPRCSPSKSSSGNPTGAFSGHKCSARMGFPNGSIPSPWPSRHGCTIYDLEEAELSYAPPFGSAKDPVNFAGMVAADILRGDMPLCHWDSVDGEFLLDVRNPPELAVECVPGAVNIPLPQLRARLGELPRDREILVICRSAQRAYYATRILLQNGFKARNISGGMLSRSMLVAK